MLRGLPTPLAPEELRASGAAARVADMLASWPSWARARFTLKPRIGTSGRGRVAGVHGLVSDAMQGAFERLASRGGAVLEPWLDRVADASAQLHVAEDGRRDVAWHSSNCHDRVWPTEGASRRV